jgi:putative membrane protein
MSESERHLARQVQAVRESAEALSRTVDQALDTADRRTELAADRTILAAERTYAAWVRSGLAALASGVGAKALLAGVIPHWLTLCAGSVLVVFSMVCFAAAVWREIAPGAAPAPDVHRLPGGLLIAINGFLILLDLAVLGGLWLGA